MKFWYSQHSEKWKKYVQFFPIGNSCKCSWLCSKINFKVSSNPKKKIVLNHPSYNIPWQIIVKHPFHFSSYISRLNISFHFVISVIIIITVIIIYLWTIRLFPNQNTARNNAEQIFTHLLTQYAMFTTVKSSVQDK